MPESSSRRWPEFGRVRAQRCGARQGLRLAAWACWGAGEHVGMCNRELRWPRRRRRHDRRRGAAAVVADGARGRQKSREEGGSTAGLTADPAEASASSGKVQRGQNGDGDLRCWRLKTTAMAAPQGVRRRTAWRGGRGLRRGAFGLVGEARPWRWVRQQRAAATAALGHEREREQRRGRSTGRVRERSGRRGVAREAQGNEGQAAGSRRWHGRVPACGEHTPRVLLARGGE